jgi:hypothetical protein
LRAGSLDKARHIRRVEKSAAARQRLVPSPCSRRRWPQGITGRPASRTAGQIIRILR